MQIFDDIMFDLIITLTYVLINNFCPCFLSIGKKIEKHSEDWGLTFCIVMIKGV